MLLIIGDMTAKVGADNHNCDRAIGAHGWGVRNNSGEGLVVFCLENNFIDGNMIFPNKDVHKLTWKSPDDLTSNWIDPGQRWERPLNKE